MFKSMEEAKEHFDQITKKDARIAAEVKQSEDGSVEAAFSVFDVLDSDGDIVLSSAFTNGQEVGMVWSHQWGSRAVGKGKIRVEKDRAVFDGRFFLDTFDGSEAYKTVKNMENLQEWSWGFRVTDYEIEEDDDSPFGYKRIIKGAEVYEVSPVLIGANRQTSTLSIKSEGEDLRKIIREEVKNVLNEMKAVETETEVEDNVKQENGETLKNLTEESIIQEDGVIEEAIRVVAEYEHLRYLEVTNGRDV